MAFNREHALRVERLLARRRGITHKRMFGGMGYLLGGNLCLAVWKEFLIARVGPAAYSQALCEPFVRPFDITGRAMKGWVMVEPEGFDSDDELRRWIERTLRFVRTLPVKGDY